MPDENVKTFCALLSCYFLIAFIINAKNAWFSQRIKRHTRHICQILIPKHNVAWNSSLWMCWYTMNRATDTQNAYVSGVTSLAKCCQNIAFLSTSNHFGAALHCCTQVGVGPFQHLCVCLATSIAACENSHHELLNENMGEAIKYIYICFHSFCLIGYFIDSMAWCQYTVTG